MTDNFGECPIRDEVIGVERNVWRPPQHLLRMPAWVLSSCHSENRSRGGELIVQPVAICLWPRAVAPPTGASDIPHHPRYALIAHAIVWTFAAIGEEMAPLTFRQKICTTPKWEYCLGNCAL